MPSRSICPSCLQDFEEKRCACEFDGIPLGPPSQPVLAIGYLRTPADHADVATLLKNCCSGPARYTGNGPGNGSNGLACRYHKGFPIWLWDAPHEEIPTWPPGSAPALHRGQRFINALKHTLLLLIEIAPDTRVFRARCARHRKDYRRISLYELLNRIEPLVECMGMQWRAVAVVTPDSSEERKQELRNRIQFWPGMPDVDFFSSRTEALDRLLKAAINHADGMSSGNVSGSFQTGDSQDHPIGSPAEDTKKEEQSETVTPEGIVSIIDLGGETGREFLSRLHEHGHVNHWVRKVSRLSDDCPMRLINSEPSSESLRWARIQDILKTKPGPKDDVPPWLGSFRHVGNGRELSVRFELHTPANPFRNPSVLLVGIGPNRRTGEKQIIELMEAAWDRSLTIPVIVGGSDSDPDLKRWAGEAFPKSRFFELNRGLLEAVHAAAACFVPNDEP